MQAFELTDLKFIQGEPVLLSDLIGKGIALIEFFATWCPPCLRSIPHLNELQKEFPKITLVGISDEESSDLSTFIKEMGDSMTYRVAADESQNVLQQYGITSIPHAFLVDTAGKIVWKGNPLNDELREEIKKQLAAEAPAAASARKSDQSRSPCRSRFPSRSRSPRRSGDQVRSRSPRRSGSARRSRSRSPKRSSR